jgi:hypothetical protein
MTRPAQLPVTACREPWPQAAGVYCTRPKDHRGGHKDENQNQYWPAEETLPAVTK